MDLLEMRDRVALLPKYNEKARLLHKKIRDKKSEITKHRNTYKGYTKSIDALIDGSFSVSLLRLIGQYDRRMNKYEQAEDDAKFAYNRAKIDLEDLESEDIQLSERISTLREEEKTVVEELKTRHTKYADLSKVAELRSERATLAEQIDNGRNILRVAKWVQSGADSTLYSLKKAKKWATWASKKGMFYRSELKARVSDVESDFKNLQKRVVEFNSLAKGVYRIQTPILREITLYFLTRTSISENIAEVRPIHEKATEIRRTLEERLKQKEERLVALKNREEELLLSL